MRVLVIADDLTGASEIAGIGWQLGLDVALLRHAWRDVEAELVVLDTGTREMEPPDAAQTLRVILGECPANGYDLVFKKVDSVLRGPVLAELHTALDVLSRSRSLLVAQNPSRGRVVVDRTYTINGTLLHRTDFALDPTYPRLTSDVHGMLSPQGDPSLTHVAPHAQVPSRGVVTGDGASRSDLIELAKNVDEHTLPAGGGDFFEAILSRIMSRARRTVRSWRFGSFLVVCGSLAEQSRSLVEQVRDEGWPVFVLPGATREEIAHALADHRGAVVTTPSSGDADGRRCTADLAEMVRAVLAQQPVDELFVTGGATAGEVCERLGCREFKVAGLWANGVVSMTTHGTGDFRITLKPGSYAFPNSFRESMRLIRSGVTN